MDGWIDGWVDEWMDGWIDGTAAMVTTIVINTEDKNKMASDVKYL